VQDSLQSFLDIFLSNLAGLSLETLPFLAVGALFSSAIGLLLPDSLLGRILPRSRVGSAFVAAAFGLVLPVCECAIVPLADKLKSKGAGETAALAFMLATPVLNPMTLVSTWTAYAGTGHPVWVLRLALGYLVAVSVALFFYRGEARGGPPTVPYFLSVRNPKPLAPTDRPRSARPRRDGRQIFLDILRGAAMEFAHASRYLCFGIVLASAVRGLVPGDGLAPVLANPIAAVGVGMIAAFALSLCSSADAFVALAFFAPRSYGAILVSWSLGQ
jgi:uncharacterized protein